MQTTQSTDPTRDSLVDAISAKVELLAQLTDATEIAKLEGSIKRMVDALDKDDAKGH